MVLREVIPELQRGLLPADVHHRSAIIQLVCDRLRAHLQKDTLSASAMDVRWGPCSFCPRDAISIYCRIAGKKEWSEITVLTLVWDVRIRCVTTLSIVPGAEELSLHMPTTLFSFDKLA